MLWGRGAVDMKDMDAMMLAALGDILDAGEQPERDLVVAFFADEEAGGDRVRASSSTTTRAVRRRDRGDQRGRRLLDHRRATAAPTCCRPARSRCCGCASSRAAPPRTGPGSWATTPSPSSPRRSRRSAAPSGRFGSPDDHARAPRRDRRRARRRPRAGPPDELALATGSASGFITATLRTTTNPTVLEAGYKHNVIPDHAEALVDIRTLPGEEEAVLAEVQALVGDEIEIEIVHRDVGLEARHPGPSSTR